MVDSHDQRSSSLEAAPKFPKCSHFRRRGDNHERCQKCRFNEGGYECTRQTPCSVCKTWLPENWDAHEKAKSQKLKRKATSAAKKLQDAMDDSIEIHAPEEVLGPKSRKSEDDSSQVIVQVRQVSHGRLFQRGAIESGLTVKSPMAHSRMETGTDRHHHRSRDEDRRRDRHSSNRDSTRRTSEWLCTEDGSSRKISLFWNFRLGLAGELNIGSHCYSMPYMKIPAINQVVL